MKIHFFSLIKSPKTNKTINVITYYKGYKIFDFNIFWLTTKPREPYLNHFKKIFWRFYSRMIVPIGIDRRNECYCFFDRRVGEETTLPIYPNLYYVIIYRDGFARDNFKNCIMYDYGQWAAY